MRILSLYSGCGGLDIGFKNAGFRTVLATDNWSLACETLSLNKMADQIICDDIRNMDFSNFRNSVIGVIGGPPCPPYSQTRHYLINKNNGFDDEKAGFAVPEFFRVIEEINPIFFLFENVDGFMYKTHQDALEYLIEESNRLGYSINYKVVNSANYGVPQTRKRFICVGYKDNIGRFVFPDETHANPSNNKQNLKDWVTSGEVLRDFDTISKEELEQRPGSKDYELLKEIPPGDNYLFFTEKRGHPSPLFKWKSRYWTFLLKLTPDRPSWTIQASFSNNQGPFHWKNRFLRIEEIKRLQTFPDNYVLSGDFKDQWRQIGNAVPAMLAEILARQIFQDLKNN